ncbi:helix-turn-helix transcriptional regulator [Nocardioides nitrophenolicus]|uniref:helix-turn-helix transcriptional regulator n=1 Tax=Nocardioides nitrophenolicus TaxID=60489 RepID=UPI00195D4C4F|nr:helix-turn-helix transcriptional regulator [Nocardioides nitrophenolicus]MBM7516929.1 DNA-binding CsgD family transcriptional regulator [Nocardioides nitrophenolicus]
MLLGGDVTRARDLLRAAYDAEGAEGAVRHELAARLALADAVAGDHAAAVETMVAIASDAPGPRRLATADATRLTRAILLLDRGLPEAAGRLVGERAASTYGSLAPIALWLQVQLRLCADQPRDGLALLDRAVTEHAVEEGAVIARAVRAEVNVALGDLRAAWDAVDPGGPRAAWTAVAEATVLYVAGEFETVRYAARVARAGHALTPRESTRLRMLEAGSFVATGDQDGAVRLLGAVLGESRDDGWHPLGLGLPRPLVSFALDHGLLPAELSEPLGWIPGPVFTAPLSPRERAVLRLLIEGADRTGIAVRLGVSLNTVKTQLRGLYAKFGVTSRSEVLRKIELLPATWASGLPDHAAP